MYISLYLNYINCESVAFSPRAFSPFSRRPSTRRISLRRANCKRDGKRENQVRHFRSEPSIDLGTSSLGPSSGFQQPQPTVSLLSPYNPLLLFQSTLKALGVSLPLLPLVLHLRFPPFPPQSTSPPAHIRVFTALRATTASQTLPRPSPRGYSSPPSLLIHASPSNFSQPNPRRIPLPLLPLQRLSSPLPPNLVLFRTEARE